MEEKNVLNDKQLDAVVGGTEEPVCYVNGQQPVYNVCPQCGKRNSADSGSFAGAHVLVAYCRCGNHYYQYMP